MKEANVGESYTFKHRKFPGSIVVSQIGKVIGSGTTADGINYVQTDVGSHTKKYFKAICPIKG
ncbi:hypothetical protein [Bacillus sp. 1P06AnD]|uniref:hypothetical protein n=1 Tax=Bacillus sp. 1P06AnD TaxID=3132208 RepID=UPI0039A08D93